jgi:hypothetical protein
MTGQVHAASVTTVADTARRHRSREWAPAITWLAMVHKIEASPKPTRRPVRSRPTCPSS